MFGTVLMDTYRETEALDLWRAIDDLCSPRDYIGWASAGIYSFWAPDQASVLYIGRALDLAERFAQHNGLVGCPPASCKRLKIQKYFRDRDRMGFTLIGQSPFAQPKSHRSAKALAAGDSEAVADLEELGRHGAESTVSLESKLIEAYRQVRGSFPPWNRIGGVAGARVDVSDATKRTLDALRGVLDNPLCARRTIRQISEIPTYQLFEEFLHAVRMQCILAPQYFFLAFRSTPDEAGIRERIIRDGYLGMSALDAIRSP